MNVTEKKTIQDFGDQWSRYQDNEGWYGSVDLLRDITMPLLDIRDIAGKNIVDIGSGTGRIVNMLLDAGASHIYAVEPSEEACEVLKKNIKKMARAGDVSVLNEKGDDWRLDEKVDYVISIGVIHHIPSPTAVIKAAYDSLLPGGVIFIWLYGYEGNEFYLRIIEKIRKITTRLPHSMLCIVVELLYGCLFIYRKLCKILPLPLRNYIENVLWPMSPKKRRLVIYDQLNPAYAKYYTKSEAVQLLEQSGFCDVSVYHRHQYSWSVKGIKPEQ